MFYPLSLLLFFQETEEGHKDEIEVLVRKVEEAKRENQDLAEALAKTRAEHDEKLDEMKIGRKTEVHALQDQVSERDRRIVDFQAAVSDLEGQIQSVRTSSENEVKLATAKAERLASEVEELRTRKKEVESSLMTATSDLTAATHAKEELYIKVEEKERQVREVTSQVQTMKVSYEKHTRELSEKLEKSQEKTEALGDLQKALDLERLRVDELQVSLGDAETERDALQSKVSDHAAVVAASADLEDQNSRLKKDLEDLRQKFDFMQAEFETERSELNEVVQSSKTLLQNKMEDFKKQQANFDRLASENKELQTLRRSVLTLETEKKEMENRIVTLTLESRGASQPRSEASTAPTSDDMSDSELRGQVDFLNSVIVDMQRKNDELKAKLELFENAGIVDTDAEVAFMLNGVSSRQVAPRLFCDICDEFDLHDTEDCPTQVTVIGSQLTPWDQTLVHLITPF